MKKTISYLVLAASVLSISGAAFAQAERGQGGRQLSQQGQGQTASPRQRSQLRGQQEVPAAAAPRMDTIDAEDVGTPPLSSENIRERRATRQSSQPNQHIRRAASQPSQEQYINKRKETQQKQ